MAEKNDPASILVIDDELGIRESLRMILLDKYNVYLATTLIDASVYLKKYKIDVVFLDIKMPNANGLEFLENIKDINPKINVVIITAFPSSQTAISALRTGAFDYIVKPFECSEILATVERALNQTADTYGNDSMIYALRKAVKRNFLSTTEALLLAIDAKDSYTAGHSKRVSCLMATISEKLGINTYRVETLRYAAFLHDIGKIALNNSLLTKSGRLTEEEFRRMKQHPDIGYKILEPVHFLRECLQIIRYHHEWYNGEGYPEGLKGEEIPQEASILSVADAYDALTTDRLHCTRVTHKKALEIISERIGLQFAPKLTEKILNVIDDYHHLIYEKNNS